MNTQVETADYVAAPEHRGASLSAGGALVVAMMVGSLMWLGLAALVF
ncbi:MAG: hypothetical protein H6900_03495 [Rhodobacter sp.]|nr:hypothetical protein [Pararhodobacter sp.]MCB1346861.1 hypothetical protein [Paracoccaceae bacterium]MCC0072335.1 hypothetical protein [Rhodobacter sp.]HPD91511.1 hypothetical protein [Pararhodobacter sp.]